jgi:hypothetical protein
LINQMNAATVARKSANFFGNWNEPVKHPRLA